MRIVLQERLWQGFGVALEGSRSLAGGPGAAPAAVPLLAGLVEPAGGSYGGVSAVLRQLLQSAGPSGHVGPGGKCDVGGKAGGVPMGGALGSSHGSWKVSQASLAAGCVQLARDL